MIIHALRMNRYLVDNIKIYNIEQTGDSIYLLHFFTIFYINLFLITLQ